VCFGGGEVKIFCLTNSLHGRDFIGADDTSSTS